MGPELHNALTRNIPPTFKRRPFTCAIVYTQLNSCVLHEFTVVRPDSEAAVAALQLANRPAGYESLCTLLLTAAGIWESLGML